MQVVIPHSIEIQDSLTPIGQKLFCYKSGVPPNYNEKEAEGKEDIGNEINRPEEMQN